MFFHDFLLIFVHKTNLMNQISKSIFALLLAASALPMTAQSKLYPNEFDLQDVTLLPSRFSHAMELNTEVLLKYDVDRLLAPYLKAAGLEPKAESFTCWDGLDGHVGGHYLSALAISYASTGNPELKKRMDYMLSELDRCQKASANGYVGGVPDGKRLWEGLHNGDIGLIWKYWVPWYNVHKIYAGLRDAWLYTGSEEARRMFLEMCDWGIYEISTLSDSQMEAMLDNEFGGMDEVYADAYAMTGDTKYLDTAKRFSHHWLLDSMADGIDNLDNKHANTQVPKVVGYQRIAELAHDSIYDKAARFFWDTVVNRRSLSLGGNSRREHFAPAADCISYVTDREGPESCNTNNMLKLTEGLFRMAPKAEYADFFERAVLNHILSTQHPSHGGYVYFTPARPGHYRVYSQPNSAMWCCVGTGMENHGKYGQFIYTHTGDSLFVNLFVPSRLNWKEKNISITQNTNFPESDKSRLTINLAKGKSARFDLLVRYPGWCSDMSVKVNGKPVKVTAKPQSYVSIDRSWKDGDVVELTMPMSFRFETLPNVPEYVSVMYGPVLLASRFGNKDCDGLIADESRWAHIANGPLVSVFDTPVLTGTKEQLEARLGKLKPVEGKPLSFMAEDEFGGLTLEPFYNIHDSRYIMYWLTMTPEEYAAHIAQKKAEEEARLALDRRTVDAVNSGEQQPEADHFMKFDRSKTGNFKDQSWRDASDGGFFSYRMKTGGADGLKLMARYWGNENGKRDFDILVDNEVLASESLAGKWGKEDFEEVVYDIPTRLTEGKDYVTVTFRSRPGTTAGGVFIVRLVR